MYHSSTVLYKAGCCSTRLEAVYQRLPNNGFTTAPDLKTTQVCLTSPVPFSSPSRPCNSFCDVTICNSYYDSFARQVWNILLQTAKYVLQNISQVCSTTRNALQACNIATFRKITFSASFCNTFFAFQNWDIFCNFSDRLSLQTTTLIGLLKTARLLRLVRVARKIGDCVPNFNL